MSRVEQIGNATRPTAIYALCEWPSEVPRYVGKTTQYIVDRHKAHIRDAMRGGRRPVHYWLRKRIAHGCTAIRLIEFVPRGEDWAARERYWIERYRADGHNLLNLTNGGEGLSGHKFSKEHRERIASKLRTGGTFACLQCGSTFWRKRHQIAKGQNKFCSRACSNTYNKGGFRGAA